MIKAIKSYWWLLIFIVVILLSAIYVRPAKAAGNRVYPLGTLIDNKALNGTAATLTFTIGPKIGNEWLHSYSYLGLLTFYDYGTGGTLVITCKVGTSTSDVNYPPDTCIVSAGTCLMNTAGIFQSSAALAADAYFSPRLGIRSYPVISCVASMSGAGANDKITITGYLTD